MSFGPSLGNREEIPPFDLTCNLGAARVPAKGTTHDYLTHPNAIPAEKMALGPCFPGVVKVDPRNIEKNAAPFCEC